LAICSSLPRFCRIFSASLRIAQVLNQAGIDDRRDRIEIAALVEQVLDLIEARFGLGALGAREHKFLAESGQLLLVQ
jgi:hypothetical protein